MKKWLILGLLGLLLLVACSDDGNEEMEESAEAYLAAVLANDGLAIADNSCAEVPGQSGSQQFLAIWSVGLALRASDTVSLSGLNNGINAETVESSESEGLVRMVGTLSFPASLQPSNQMPLPVDDFIEFDETWRMVKEGDVWKWCGGVFE